MTWLGMCLAIVATLIVAGECAAQEPAAQDGNPKYTLHISVNLLQIPVLVLGPRLEGVPRFDLKNLTVTLGAGAPFHPSHIRPEGDDPLALAILLDVSEAHSELAHAFADAVETMAESSLHPRDRVAIYALDCSVTRIGDYAPAEAHQLKLSAAQASKATTPRESRFRRSCGGAVHLHDAMQTVDAELAEQPGRRVMLVIGSGSDNGSKSSEEDVHVSANHNGVAVFGLTEAGSLSMSLGRRGGLSSLPVAVPLPLALLCEKTGGIALMTSADGLTRSLARFVKQLRERVIVEFPRPKDPEAEKLVINVYIAKTVALIRPAGTSATILDSHAIADTGELQREEASPPDSSAPGPNPVPGPPH